MTKPVPGLHSDWPASAVAVVRASAASAAVGATSVAAAVAGALEALAPVYRDDEPASTWCARYERGTLVREVEAAVQRAVEAKRARWRYRVGEGRHANLRDAQRVARGLALEQGRSVPVWKSGARVGHVDARGHWQPAQKRGAPRPTRDPWRATTPKSREVRGPFGFAPGVKHNERAPRGAEAAA